MLYFDTQNFLYFCNNKNNIIWVLKLMKNDTTYVSELD